MPKYLVQASYSVGGAKGLLRDGGTKRRATIEALMKGVGGRVEAFYYAFGDADVYCIVEAPDNATLAAVSLTINASGVVSLKTTPLLTAEEIDQAAKTTVHYQPPGQ